MREFEGVAREGDIWDSGFSTQHSLTNATELRRQVVVIRAEAMIEEGMALIYRSSFDEADRLLADTIDLLRDNDLFIPLAPHLLLLYAQYAHLVGQSSAAERYYRACQSVLQPGSELGLIIEIGLFGCQGKFERVLSDTNTRQEIESLIEHCRTPSNAVLSTTGFFLSSLIESAVSSKKKFSAAWDAVQKSKTVMLPVLYAFFAAKDVSGHGEKFTRILEGGREAARSLGGGDRADGVGQTTLGLWFAVKLKEWFRGRDEQSFARAASSVISHQKRRQEISEKGAERFRLKSPVKRER